MTNDKIGQRLTALRSETLALLEDVSGDSKTPHGEHSNLISSLQQVANQLGGVEARAST